MRSSLEQKTATKTEPKSLITTVWLTNKCVGVISLGASEQDISVDLPPPLLLVPLSVFHTDQNTQNLKCGTLEPCGCQQEDELLKCYAY